MKHKRIIISLSLAALVLGSGGLIAGTTLAGYQKDAPITQDVKVQRYIFLDVQNWNADSPDFYVYLFNLKESSSGGEDYKKDPDARMWIKGTLYSGTKYWFYIPTKYEYGLFLRAKSGAPLADIQSWQFNVDTLWNQTADINLNVRENESSPKYNLFTPDGTNVNTVTRGVFSLA